MIHRPLIHDLADRARAAEYCTHMASMWSDHLDLTTGDQHVKAEAYADAFRSVRMELCGDGAEGVRIPVN